MTDLIAHRGFAADHSENTLGAFRAAARTADAIEFDVRRCASGELVVFHDETLDRVTDRRGLLAETTFGTLRECEVLGSGESVPRLETVVDAVPESIGLHVEIKERGLADDAVRVLAAASNDVTISAFDARVLEAVTEANSRMSTAYLFADDPNSGITAATTLDCDYVHPHYRLVLDTDLLDRARDHGLGVNAWTVDDGSVGSRLSDCGVDGVIADSRDVLSR